MISSAPLNRNDEGGLMEQAKQSGLTWNMVLVVLAFGLVRDLLSSWLIKPFAFGVAILIVFPLIYPLEHRKVTFARWLSFIILAAVLVPGVVYGTPYLLCAYEPGAVIYGLLVGVLSLSMRSIFVGLHGEARGTFKRWALASICIGIAAGIVFYFYPDVFCDAGIRLAS
jgi:ABC-type spermidine/putrescine transport system permease subunit II